MKKRLFIAAILLLIIISFARADVEKKPFTVDDGLNMVSIYNPQISPCGKWILFTKRELKWKDNKYESYLWLVPTDGGEAYKYTNEPGDSSPQWSPDGKYVTFLRGKADERQLWIMRTTGGEAIQLTEHKASIQEFHWTKDSKNIIFLAPDIKTKEEKEEEKLGDDIIYVYEGPNGQLSKGRWTNFWHFNLETKKEKQITKEKILVQDFDVSPDGKHIVYVYRTEDGRNRAYLAEIAMVDIDDGAITKLTDNKAPEGMPLWSPDGNKIAYLAPDDKTWELRNEKIWIMDVATRDHKMVSGKFVGSIYGDEWAPDGKSIIFIGITKTKGNIFSLDIANGDIKQLTNKEGVIGQISLSADGKKAACVYTDNKEPNDVWAIEFAPYKEEKLTDANPWIKERSLANMKVISWKGKDGLPIEGILYLPPDYKEGTKVPLILNVHGGPAGVFVNRFSASYHIFADLGYASLCPNVRGSSAYSDELLRGNMNDIGGGDYWDLMTGVDEVIKQGIVDEEKMGIRGWSYGGILSGWTVTQTNRFKAASLGAMVCDWAAEYGMGFNFDVKLWYIGGTPWENPAKYREMSSLTHIKNVETPVILFHGDKDPQCTIGQSMMYFTYLFEMDKAVRFLRFPGEPHGFQKPYHQRVQMVEEIAWMQKHIKGIEWTSKRAKEKGEEKEEKEKEEH
jgi:dipeptidyl aminopeptidase/acylaminoacyl peptidase